MRNFGSRLDKIEKGRGKAFAFLIRDENETQEDAIAAPNMGTSGR